MTSPRQAKSIRRQANLVAVLFGIFAIAISAIPGIRRSPNPAAHDLFFRQPLDSLPSWVGYGWLPLDFVVIAGMSWLLCYLMFSSQDRKEPSTIREYTMLVLLGPALLGCFTGISLTIMGGWLVGVQGFILGVLAAIALLVVLGALMGITYVVQRFVTRTYEVYVAPALAPLTTPLRRYFNAEDIPDTEESPGA